MGDRYNPPPLVPLSAGIRIGPYEVVAALGAGGMGEVYRARDAKLGRDVAIKVLPESLAADADRIARFEREAKVLASLNHPHIAQIYGLEEGQVGPEGRRAVHALVMELVEGEDLAQRIERGPMPLDETLPIARQIADALEAAHEQGIIHRDLKPANIKVRPDGTVKVLDFGLAKLADQASGFGLHASDMSQSPTMASPALMTGAGMILGTAAYMSPEQARGRALDKRVDIWAFGCVVFEMLSGRRAFEGEDVAETIGAAIHKEPRWDALPASTPPAVRATLERCLQKDPRLRVRDIGDVRLAMEGGFGSTTGALPSAAPARRSRLPLAAVAGFAGALIAGALVWVATRSAPVPRNAIHFQLVPPASTHFRNFFSLSPDGRFLSFATVDPAGLPALWVHSFESGLSRQLSSGAGANSQVWSPDGRFLAYGAAGVLRKFNVQGGLPETICTLPGPFASGVWTRDEMILFGTTSGGLMRVPVTGGTPVEVTKLDPSRSEVGHTNPALLSDDRHFVYFRESRVAGSSGIYIGSLDLAPETQPATRLLATDQGALFSRATASEPARLLFLREGTLVAQTLDEKTMTLVGEANAIASGVGVGPPTYAHLAISDNGVLAYQTREPSPGGIPTWYDRTGRELGPIAGLGTETGLNPRISRDGKRLALVVDGDVWVYDAGGRPPIRLTFTGGNLSPLWTPDGQTIVYEPPRSAGLRAVAADGSVATPEQVTPAGHYHPHSWSAGGRELLAVKLDSDPRAVSGWDIFRVPFRVPGDPVPVVQTPAIDGYSGAAVSPDGHWLAYTSDSTGTLEVWVRPYPGPGAAIRVSGKGGIEPTWTRGGRELVYLEGSRFMSTAITATAGVFGFSAPVELFEAPTLQGTQPPSYDVAPDGRLLLLKPVAAPPSAIDIVINWTEALNGRAPE